MLQAVPHLEALNASFHVVAVDPIVGGDRAVRHVAEQDEPLQKTGSSLIDHAWPKLASLWQWRQRCQFSIAWF
jgi:hypothetical protein